MQEFGLYIHIPFCRQKCLYCNFYSLPQPAALYPRYVHALGQQMQQAADVFAPALHPVGSIFFGGGTPSLLPPELLAELLARCRRHFVLAEDVEISLEANPGSVSTAKLQQLRRAGFNRLSLGIQSFQDHELQRLGRSHSAAEALASVQQARTAGFTNLSMDLMYGLPEQQEQDWQATLDQALDLAPEHLSIYELSLEPETAFAQQGLALPDEEQVLGMLAATLHSLYGAGYQRYEISNYALAGFQCRHNCIYWRSGSWLGLGPSAVSSIAGRRYFTAANVEDFFSGIEAGHILWQAEEALSSEAQFRESVVMGLRLLEGFAVDDLEQRFAYNALSYYGDTLIRLQEQDLVELCQGRVRLSPQGLLLANRVMAELV